MSHPDYASHLVSRQTWETVVVGQPYAGGLVAGGFICGVTERPFLITYHGPEDPKLTPEMAKPVTEAATCCGKPARGEPRCPGCYPHD